MNRRHFLKSMAGAAVVVALPANTYASEVPTPHLIASRDWGLEYQKDTTWKLYSEVRAFTSDDEAREYFGALVDDPQTHVRSVGRIRVKDVVGIRKDVQLELGEDAIYLVCKHMVEFDVIVTYKANVVYLFLIQAERQRDKDDCYEVIQDVVDRNQSHSANDSILDLLPDEDDVEPLGLDQLDDERVYEPLD